MATNLILDDKLIEEALRLSGHKTPKAAVTDALQEYINRKKQLEILNLFNKIEFDDDYDYKEQRMRR